jgi:hypothetical protein
MPESWFLIPLQCYTPENVNLLVLKAKLDINRKLQIPELHKWQKKKSGE